MTETTPYSDAAESRRLVRADADEFGVLLPESVLSKRHASNETRALPLQSRALLEAESDFSFREIIRVVPRR